MADYYWLLLSIDYRCVSSFRVFIDCEELELLAPFLDSTKWFSPDFFFGINIDIDILVKLGGALIISSIVFFWRQTAAAAAVGGWTIEENKQHRSDIKHQFLCVRFFIEFSCDKEEWGGEEIGVEAQSNVVETSKREKREKAAWKIDHLLNFYVFAVRSLLSSTKDDVGESLSLLSEISISAADAVAAWRWAGSQQRWNQGEWKKKFNCSKYFLWCAFMGELGPIFVMFKLYDAVVSHPHHRLVFTELWVDWFFFSLSRSPTRAHFFVCSPADVSGRLLPRISIRFLIKASERERVSEKACIVWFWWTSELLRRDDEVWTFSHDN